MPIPHLPTIPLALQQQALLDLASRVRHAAMTYAVLWLILAAGFGLLSRQPGVALGVAAVLLLMGLARIVLTRHMPQLVQRHFRWARAVFRSVMLLHISMWGVLCAVSLHWAPTHSMETYLLLAGAALLQGGVASTALDPVLRIGFPVAGLLPVVLAALLRGQPQDLVLAMMGAVLLAYILATSRSMSSDYWDAQFARITAEDRAQQLERISRTDALTTIPNRLAFNEQLATEWQRARRDGSTVAVAMIDLDHFKLINDQHGHPVGDLCLAAAAQALRSALLRPSDSVARYGGEEFVALLPGTSLAGALNTAERLAASLRQCQVLAAGQPVPLRCSIGVHALAPGQRDQPPNDVHSLLRGADQALYRAKHAGRDRVEVFASDVAAGAAPTTDTVPAGHAAA